MNIEQAKARLAELKAMQQVVEWFIEDGGYIDYMVKDRWITISDPTFYCWRTQRYRRTPKPRYVPFTLDTFPKCPVWVRINGHKNAWYVNGVEEHRICYGECATASYEGAVNTLEISLDHRQTWQPCGERREA